MNHYTINISIHQRTIASPNKGYGMPGVDSISKEDLGLAIGMQAMKWGWEEK